MAIPWGTIRANSLIVDGSTVDPSQITTPQNVVTSGKVRATSNQGAFITPNGAALSFILAGATTNLVFDVNGTSVSVTTDITKSSLTAAPSANNTALVNDADAADQADTRLWGEPEHRKAITIDTIGSEISSLDGKLAAFQIDNGSATEYFVALVDTSNNRLTNCRRGFFYDSSLAPKNRIVFSNNDTITLLKMGWIFVENNGTTVDVSYTPPVWSSDSPNSPATGDYWYDIPNSTWKRYDGATFQIINRTFVGVFANTSAACVGARCEPFYAKHDGLNSVEIDSVFSVTVVRAKKRRSEVSVYGTRINFGDELPRWDITADLASSADMYNATEQASTLYYLYVKDTGDRVISDISPYYVSEFYGLYHPHNPWRCVGIAFNNSGSDLLHAGDLVNNIFHFRASNGNGHGSSSTKIRQFSTVNERIGGGGVFNQSGTTGDNITIAVPGQYQITTQDGDTGGGSSTGISLNIAAADHTTNITSLSYANGFRFNGRCVAASQPAMAGGILQLKIGDVIRSHDNGNTDLTTDYVVFQVSCLQAALP